MKCHVILPAQKQIVDSSHTFTLDMREATPKKSGRRNEPGEGSTTRIRASIPRHTCRDSPWLTRRSARRSGRSSMEHAASTARLRPLRGVAPARGFHPGHLPVNCRSTPEPSNKDKVSCFVSSGAVAVQSPEERTETTADGFVEDAIGGAATASGLRRARLRWARAPSAGAARSPRGTPR
jgi:hypothetical protein